MCLQSWVSPVFWPSDCACDGSFLRKLAANCLQVTSSRDTYARPNLSHEFPTNAPKHITVDSRALITGLSKVVHDT